MRITMLFSLKGATGLRRLRATCCCTSSTPYYRQPRSQGPFSTSRKYPGCGWSRVYVCQAKPHRGWVLNLILSTFSREVNVGLLYGRYFEKEASYLSEILPGQLLGLYLNFYEYEMLIKTELCSYFTAFFFLNKRQQPASD